MSDDDDTLASYDDALTHVDNARADLAKAHTAALLAADDKLKRSLRTLKNDLDEINRYLRNKLHGKAG